MVPGTSESGATTPSLCTEYTLLQGGLLKLLRDERAQLRCQPLTNEQVREATALSGNGKSRAAIADHFGVSYNSVRQAVVRAGIQRRLAGGVGLRRPRSPLRPAAAARRLRAPAAPRKNQLMSLRSLHGSTLRARRVGVPTANSGQILRD